MNLVEFLENLSQQNVELWVENDKLRYRAPKEALTPTLLNQIKQHKTEIVDLLSEDLDSSKSYSLSYGQQGLWFMYKLAPHSAAYNIAFTVRICSHLNIPALQRAVQTLVARHPALRTKFSQGDGAPFQEIQESQEVYIETIDASSWDEDKLTQEAIATYKHPFDLSRGVMRATLFTRSSQEYVLLLVIHHIAVDGFSFGIILDELRLLYEGENTGYSVSLAPVEYSYQDFVRWQQKMLKSPVGEELWTYWQKQFTGELPVLNMPTDYPRPLVQNYQGACYDFELNQGLSYKLRELGKAQGATLYMTLLTAFAVLLHRYTGQSEIVVGSPTEGRSKAEFTNTVGFFVNMLAMRVNLADNLSFSELLSQVRKTVLAALTNQDYPSPLLIERLQLNRDPGLIGLFRASFNLLQFQEMAPEYELSMSTKTTAREDWGGLKLEPFVIPQQEGQNDLLLDIVETAESLVGIFRYSTDLFDGSTIERMAGHFQNLLSAIVENPQQAVGEIPLLSDKERHELLVSWNDTKTEYPSDKCIHQLFEQQVEKTPDALAVVFESEELTYQQLNQRANQLAHYLQTLGVEPEVLVGICVERSVSMVVGLLGILKAGGTYVPLDPNYPQERLSYMLSDSGVGVLLTHSSLLSSLPSHRARVVCLDRAWEKIEQNSQDNLDVGVCADNLAYVIYTSGSTGKPKATMIEHRGCVNHCYAMIDTLELTHTDTIAQTAPIGFDISVWQILTMLLIGGKVSVISNEIIQDPSRFFAEIETQEISVVQVVPSLLATMLDICDHWGAKKLSYLRWLSVTGEAFNTNLMHWWFKYYPWIGLVNAYGPAECSDDVTLYPIGYGENPQLLNSNTVPIGKPIANTQIYILDTHLQPVPIGVPGELHIGGDGLARGYLNRPELTQSKFIPNPFDKSKVKSQKSKEGLISPSASPAPPAPSASPASPASPALYKTGDLARYLPDGNIEFLGRIDNQVKLRGFRIELGEIEAVLSTHPQVQEVVVILREEQVDNKYLVAYFVTRQESLSTKEIRDFIKQKLPDYMVPSAFVSLEAFPLTPNGKIDRRALPAPDIEENRQVEFVPPSTSTEVAIADIFISVLKLQRVGIHDNFFELGGHSLLATQVVSRLQQTFKVEFPLRSLLESPTVAGLDQNLAQYRLVESPSETLAPLPTIVPTPEQRHQPFPLTDIQQAYWLGRNDAFELGNIAAHGYIELDSKNLNLQRLNLAWQKLIDRHDMLRVIILPDGQQQVQEVVPPYEIELLDLRGQPPEVVNAKLDSIRDRMSHEVLSADRFPLFEIRATRLDEVRTRLHLSFDALIADAWSIFVLGREWAKLYENPEIVLPPLELSFRDYVLAELSLSNTLQYRRSQEYWFNRLETLPPGAELPLAKNPSSITKPEFKRRSAQLSPTQWKQLKDRGNQFNLTPSGVLLGAFAQILGFWSKSQKFTINLTLFNRLSVHPQVNDIVGDFTSLTLLEVDNSGANTFVKSAQQLQQQLWQDLDRGSISAVKVQRELNRRRESYQIVPIVFTSTLGLESLGERVSIFEGLGEEIYSISQTPQVWLDNQVREKNGGLIFNWDGVEELFPEGLLDDMFGAYCNLLERLATSESAWMEVQQQLLPPTQLSQRHQVNNTQAAICEKTLHGLFIDQVKAQPQQVAVITNECQLTYSELYQRASALAQRLQQLGVTPNTLVAVVMEKGWEQVVGVLGILMSGGAYLPIDPSLPPQRQHYLLSQGQVKLVVTQCHLEPDISLPPGVQSLSVENILTIEAPDIPSLDDENNSNLAYVIYTSGSTGLPKGVAIDHRGAVNTIVDINQRFGIGNTDCVLAISALNFDLSVYDIFGMLAAGGTIVIPPQDAVKDPGYWYELIVKFGVTIWNTVPALMQMLTEYLSAQPAITPLPLRLALLSGDWLPLSLPTQIQSYCGEDMQIISLGGATEASIWSICYPIETVNPNWKSIPYGKPLTNQNFQILNELMLPTPVWVPGQLYIGGIGLANGYWGDEEKTNASFITHPVTGERLYKTGDLGRYLPDGNIEFLGRDDFQVKINGYRIELGEIETTLKQHPAIKEAIVIAVGESQNKQQLVAYIVGEPSTQNPAEAYQPSQQSGVLQDPVERIEFKLKQPGLRQLEPSQHSVQLPQPEFDDNLTQAYLKRQSYRQFLPRPISLTEFSQFLSCLQQMKLENYPLPKYLYPSAGNLYPVQTYLLIKPNTVEGLKAGIYYYHPVEHRLILVSDIKEIDGSIYRGNQPIFDNGAFSLFLIGELNAIAPMYGELAKDFCLLEAGHIGQLLMKSAPEQEIGLCPIGYLDLKEIQDLFKLESSQILLYSFVGGKIDLAHTKQWLSSQNIQDSQSISVQLRKYLRQKLPGYMIPYEYISLDALPLTANGKVDRKKLPVPNILNSQAEAVFTPPRTEIEKKLAEFVQELLQIDAVGIDNNFFQLGMDSLKLVQLKNKLQTQLGVNISMKQLLVEANNIAELAVAVDEQLTLVRIKSLPLSAESNDDTEIIEL